MLRKIAPLLLFSTIAAADPPLGSPDPTHVAPAPAPLPREPDPCDQVPQCRIDRFRAAQARLRRREYIRRVEAAAREMDARIERQKPLRTRFALEADLALSSNLALPGLVLAYAPAWWLKLEGQVGRYEHNHSSYTSLGYSSNKMQGFVAGTGVHITPIKWALSPYLSAGWAYVGGSFTDYSTGDAGGVGHLVLLGLGVRLVVPYFHVAVGYQFAHAFYAQATLAADHSHDPALRDLLQANLDDNHHGVAFEIGSVF